MKEKKWRSIEMVFFSFWGLVLVVAGATEQNLLYKFFLLVLSITNFISAWNNWDKIKVMD